MHWGLQSQAKEKIRDFSFYNKSLLKVLHTDVRIDIDISGSSYFTTD